MTAAQPAPILQRQLRYAPWRGPQGHRLPGTGPCDPAEWLLADEARAAQMALRARLADACPEAVLACRPGAEPAARELLEEVTAWLRARDMPPAVPPDPARPMHSLCHLVQEDLCLLERQGAEHVLTAAALCFPAHWALAEKLGRPLTAIHRPVAPYDAGVARRVQRLFDGLRPGVVLERSNCLPDHDFRLFQPRPKPPGFRRPGGEAPFIRLERQTLRKLPRTGAVVFAIHTAVFARAALEAAGEGAALAAHLEKIG
jgi:hypothetical protein